MSSLRPPQPPRHGLLRADPTETPQTTRPRKRRRNGSAVPLGWGQAAPLATAGVSSLREEVAARAVDAVTLGALRDPYVLGDCGHSFDAKTLEALVRSGGAACPLCRAPVLTPSVPNYLGRELLDVLQRYGLSEGAAQVLPCKGPIAAPRPLREGASATDGLGTQFCCAGVAWMLATLGLGIKNDEPVRNACAVAACAAGGVGLAAGYALVAYFPLRRLEPRGQAPA